MQNTQPLFLPTAGLHPSTPSVCTSNSSAGTFPNSTLFNQKKRSLSELFNHSHNNHRKDDLSTRKRKFKEIEATMPQASATNISNLKKNTLHAKDADGTHDMSLQRVNVDKEQLKAKIEIEQLKKKLSELNFISVKLQNIWEDSQDCYLLTCELTDTTCRLIKKVYTIASNPLILGTTWATGYYMYKVFDLKVNYPYFNMMASCITALGISKDLINQYNLLEKSQRKMKVISKYLNAIPLVKNQ